MKEWAWFDARHDHVAGKAGHCPEEQTTTTIVAPIPAGPFVAPLTSKASMMMVMVMVDDHRVMEHPAELGQGGSREGTAHEPEGSPETNHRPDPPAQQGNTLPSSLSV